MLDKNIILSRVNCITKNIIVRDYIEKTLLENENANANVHFSDDSMLIVSFTRKDSEYTLINISYDDILVDCFLNGNHQKFEWKKGKYGSTIKFHKFEMRENLSTFLPINDSDEEYVYDCCEKFISRKYKCINCIYDTQMKKIAEKYGKGNFLLEVNDLVVGDKILQKRTIDFDYFVERNTVEFFLADYCDGMLSTSDVLPEYVSISREKFENIVKTDKQMKKTML